MPAVQNAGISFAFSNLICIFASFFNRMGFFSET